MNFRTVSVLALLAAVLAASVAYVINGINKREEALLLANAESSKEARLEAERKIKKAEADAAIAKKRTAEADAKAAADRKESALIEKRTAEIELDTESRNQAANEAAAKAAAEEAAAAKFKAEEARLAAEKSRNELEKAKALEKAESLKAQAAEDALETERLRSEKVIAEAKALELSMIDFENWQNELIELNRQLEERERALMPEKTIADLAWVGGDEDMVIGSNGTVRVVKKEPYLAENDRALPRETRLLSKVMRRTSESREAMSGILRDAMVEKLEKLYVLALKEDRVVDARYYKESIKSLYPDWEFKGEAKATEKEKRK